MYYPFLYKQYFEGKETHLSLSIKSVNPKNAALNLDGYKHSMVQIVALALASKTTVIIENPPLVIDTYVFVALIKEMGGDARIIHNKLHLDMRNVCINTISYYLSQLIHGSMYLCPALLCLNGEFSYYGSGGCRIGNGKNNERPVEHIMSVMKSFGASIEFNQFGIHGKYNSDDFGEPVEVDILKYSTTPKFLSGALVGGATKTAIIMSLSRDTVIIKNPYMKTDVLDMISFVQMIGKSVVINQNELIISGKLHTNCNFAYRITLTECVSEIITYASLAILQHTKLTFRNLNKSIIVRGLKPEFELFDKMGIEYKWEQSDLIIEPTFNISPQIIDVLPQTIQSDHQPFFALLLSYGKGVSTITDHVWKDRYHYISNLIRAVVPLEINHKAIEMYFSYRFIPAPYTVYNDVFKLKAGEQIIFLMNEGTTRKHCSKYNFIVSETQFNASNCERVLRRSIISTFNHGDVPIGLYLSGGIDSGIIASIIKDKLRNEGSALHIEYPGNSEKMPEERTLLPVISELGIRCKRIVFDDTILDNIERIAFSLDEPFYSTVSASTYALSKKAKESVKGVLTGDGSDELIFGYKYLREALQQRDPYQAYLNGIGWLKYVDYRSLLESYSLNNDDINHILFSDCIIPNSAPETLRRVEVFRRLPDYHLMRLDRLTMAFGVEARVPYLRNECVEMFLKIGNELFLKTDAKSPLKKAFFSTLPPVLLQTTKQPFYAPTKKWIEEILHIAVSNGRFCGAKRPRCAS